MANRIEEMICIVCPMSCHLEIEISDTNEILNVSGNTCPRGKTYGENETANPTRMLTSTVKLNNGPNARLPVITSGDIPKGKMFDVMSELQKIQVCAPVHINDIIIENVCGLPVHIIAGRSVECVNI